MLCNHIDVNRQSTVGHHCPISERVGLAMTVPPGRYHIKAYTYGGKCLFPVILSSERNQVYTFDQFT